MRRLLLVMMLLLIPTSLMAEGIAQRPYRGLTVDDIPGTQVDWTGAYAGVHGNYSMDDDTWQAGGQLEYYKQWQSGLVLGGVIDATLAWERAHNFLAEANEECLPGSTGLQWYGSARVVAGFSTGLFLPFATVGWALGQADTKVEELGSSRDFVNGLVYGAGVAMRVGPNMVLKTEYLRYEFGELNDTGVNLNQDIVRLSVNWKF